MTWPGRVRAAAAIVVVSALLAGCSGAVQGSAVAGEPWDPCSITPEALADAGLDPEYREGWGDGIVVEDWELCFFKPPVNDIPYFVSVMASVKHNVEEMTQDPTNLDGRQIAVDGHPAFQYRTEVGRTGRSCHIAVGLAKGVVVFAVDDASELADARLCDLVVQYANELRGSLPTN